VRSASPDLAGRVCEAPWATMVLHSAVVNESVHSTLSHHLHVREGFNLRLPLWATRDDGLADPVPMDASATALFSGAKWHPISTDVCRRVPNKKHAKLSHHISPLPLGRSMHVQFAVTSVAPGTIHF
jgi:hypothetical protein